MHRSYTQDAWDKTSSNSEDNREGLAPVSKRSFVSSLSGLQKVRKVGLCCSFHVSFGLKEQSINTTVLNTEYLLASAQVPPNYDVTNL